MGEAAGELLKKRIVFGVVEEGGWKRGKEPEELDRLISGEGTTTLVAHWCVITWFVGGVVIAFFALGRAGWDKKRGKKKKRKV